MASNRWSGTIDYIKDMVRTDIDNIKWVLPMAIIIGFYIVMVFGGVDLIMENRERAGRYQGMDAISYTLNPHRRPPLHETESNGPGIMDGRSAYHRHASLPDAASDLEKTP